MTDDEMTSGCEHITHAVEQRHLGRLIKIDHHVATEDDVERAGHRPVLEQVQATEGDEVPNPIGDLDQAGVGAGTPSEPAPQPHAGDPGDPLGLVDAGLCLPENIGVDVCGQDPDVPAFHRG